MGSEGAFGVVTAVTVRVRPVPGGQGLRGLALGLLRRRAPPRCARSPRPACCRPCCASPTRPRPRSTSAEPAEVGGEAAGGCLMVTGYEGTPEAVAARRAPSPRCSPALGGTAARRGAGRGLGRGPVPRALPARLAARRRGARRDLETVTFWSNLPALYAAVKAAAHRGARRRARRWCSATSRTSTRPAPRSTSPWPPSRRDDPLAQWLAAKAAATRRDRRRRRLDHPPPRRRPGPQALAGRARSARSAWRCCARSRSGSTRTGVLNPGVLIP